MAQKQHLTNLNPINDASHIPSLKQKLFTLHPYSEDILAFDVIARKTAFRVL